MRYPAEIYAKALVEVLEGSARRDEDRITKSFLKILEKNGDLRNSEKIFKEIRKAVVKRSSGKFIEIESARPLGEELKLKLEQIFSEKDYIEFREREELLAGARILADGEQEMDFSFQRKLRQLFK